MKKFFFAFLAIMSLREIASAEEMANYPEYIEVPAAVAACMGDIQAPTCAYMRDDANIRGSTGGSDSPSADSESK